MTTTAAAWMPMRLCTCARCGFTFGHPSLVGRRPRLCQQCRLVPEPKPGAFDPATPGYRVLLALTDARLAIEQARALLRLGRTDVALAVLDHVQAPGQPTRREARRP